MSNESAPMVKTDSTILKVDPEVWTYVSKKGKLAQHIWLQPQVLAWIMTEASKLEIAPNQLIAAIVTSAYMHKEALIKVVEPEQKEVVKEIPVYVVTCPACQLLNKTVRLPVDEFFDHVKNEHCGGEGGQ